MSAEDDLERILCARAGSTFPEPDGETTRRARERVVAVVPRYRRRRAALQPSWQPRSWSPLGHGVSIGSLIARTSPLPRGPWRSASSPSRAGSRSRHLALPGRPAGRRDGGEVSRSQRTTSSTASPSPPRCPTRRCWRCRPAVSSSSRRSSRWTRSSRAPGSIPKRALPLRIWQATPYIEYGTQIPPRSASGPVPAPRRGLGLERRGERVLRDCRGRRCASSMPPSASSTLLRVPRLLRNAPADGDGTCQDGVAVLARPHVHLHARVSWEGATASRLASTAGRVAAAPAGSGHRSRRSARAPEEPRPPPWRTTSPGSAPGGRALRRPSPPWLRQRTPSRSTPGGTVAVNLGLCRGSAGRAPIAPRELVART